MVSTTTARSRGRGRDSRSTGGTTANQRQARRASSSASSRQKKRLTKHEVDFLTRHSPGRHQDDAAEREPVSGHRVSERAERTGVSHLLGRFSGTWCRSSSSEFRRCVDEGVKYIQIDAPRYSYYLDPKWREYVTNGDGREPRGGARRSHPRGQRLPRGRAARRASSWPSTSAAATTGASGTPRAATTRSPRSCSTS